jgi:hypothetical protein
MTLKKDYLGRWFCRFIEKEKGPAIDFLISAKVFRAGHAGRCSSSSPAREA